MTASKSWQASRLTWAPTSTRTSPSVSTHPQLVQAHLPCALTPLCLQPRPALLTPHAFAQTRTPQILALCLPASGELIIC